MRMEKIDHIRCGMAPASIGGKQPACFQIKFYKGGMTMILVRHELRQGRGALGIWTAAVGLLLAVCIFIFPEMENEMGGMGDLFGSMGSFTEAFGMDQVNFGTFIGFYSVECGNILGLGGALFSALCGVSILAKEEGEHTAEFLLTHPVSRRYVAAEKLFAVMIEIFFFNLCVFGIAVISIALCGEAVPWREIGLLHFAYWLLQVEIAGICFGISAFLRRGTAGVGLGIAILFYFLHLIANISKNAKFLRYITPFAYANGTQIVAEGKIAAGLALCGMLYATAGIAIAFFWYGKKDIA